MKYQRPGRSTRIVLMWAFGGLLALLVAAGWEAMSILDEAHERERLARAEFLARNECLINIDSKLTLYSRLVEFAQVTGAAVPLVSPQLEAELRNYPPARSPEEQSLLNQLESALADQDRLVSHGEVRESLAGHLRVVAATEQIAVWNNDRFRGADAQLLAGFDAMRFRLRGLLSILLGSGLLLSIGSVVYIAGQEREARERYAELSESRDSQESLSARLLDAQEEERRSISRELHDEVGQSLGALLVDVGRLAAQLPPEDRLQEQIHSIRAVAERTVAAVRNMALLLRPSMLDDLGLAAALEWQAREVSRRSEMEVEVKPDLIPADLTEEQKVCVYRFVQEALNNAARHSGARQAWVSVQPEEARLIVEVRDNGRGFDPSRTRGLGLLGMEERIRRLHGTLRIESADVSGTIIRAELPVA